VQQLAAGYRPVDVNSANLQGWWPLSGYSSPEPDISGNANNGTLTGTTQAPMPPSISRGARSFDGSSSYIDIPGVSQPTALTISAWVYANALPPNTGQRYWGVAGVGGSNHVIYFRNNSTGTINFAYYIATSLGSASIDTTSGTLALATGRWYHVMMAYDSTNGLLTFVNGVSDGTTAANGTATSSAVHFQIANDTQVASRLFNGLIADVAIWNTNLLAADAGHLASGYRPVNVNSANLIGWWPLNGFNNSTENDLSSSANNGTLNPGSASGPFPILGPPQTWRLG
jgi:hypothetical protein